MDIITTRNTLTATSSIRDYIMEQANILGWPANKTKELINVAQKSIETALELLEQWKDLGENRAYGFSIDRSFIVNQPDSRKIPFIGLNIFFHLWPFGTDSNVGESPQSVHASAYIYRHNFIAEQFEAIVNDILESIKKAEELINPTTKEE